jgi:hypothetical protein
LWRLLLGVWALALYALLSGALHMPFDYYPAYDGWAFVDYYPAYDGWAFVVEFLALDFGLALAAVVFHNLATGGLLELLGQCLPEEDHRRAVAKVVVEEEGGADVIIRRNSFATV